MNKTSQKLIKWFNRQDCEMPWRKTKDIYKIWISEIMLQQTQVNTVIRYYQPFIDRFPTIQSLAKSSEDEVLHLGLYPNQKDSSERIN